LSGHVSYRIELPRREIDNWASVIQVSLIIITINTANILRSAGKESPKVLQLHEKARLIYPDICGLDL